MKYLAPFTSFGFLMLALNMTIFAQKLSVTDLKVEHQVNPLAVVPGVPRLSWKLVSSEKNTFQRSYEIRVSTDVRKRLTLE